jgi:UPF0042 nucleotide-binding protein
MKLIFISGRSGSGKSAALHALEDCGFYCIDNLPESLLPDLINTIATSKEYDHTAISIDVRNFSGSHNKLEVLLKTAEAYEIEYQVLFLDSDEDTIIKRYNASRRKHPLSSDARSLRESIQHETKVLAPLRNTADLILDTSTLSVHELREMIRNRVSTHKRKEVSLLFQSFGFKYGVPTDSDLIFDVRCLPNPYWEPTLRNFTGKDPQIAEFLEKQPETHSMLNDIRNFVERWTPSYEKSGRAYLTVSIGCTGGCHRSVYITERLVEHFKATYPEVHLKHIQL